MFFEEIDDAMVCHARKLAPKEEFFAAFPPAGWRRFSATGFPEDSANAIGFARALYLDPEVRIIDGRIADLGPYQTLVDGMLLPEGEPQGSLSKA